MASWFNGAWFGGGSSKSSDNTKAAILKLRDQMDTLEKREAHFEHQIQELEEKAKANATKNKPAALAALRRKKLLEQELKTMQGTMAMLESQKFTLENANITSETMKVLKQSSKAMKSIQKDATPEAIDATFDELQEHRETANLMSERISQYNGMDQIDEDELLGELQELEQEKLDEQMLSAGAPPVSVPNGAEKQKQPAKQIEEDDEEAELRKLQAEMAM